MLFNSFSYLVFFPLVALAYFLLPFRFRWLHLLLASCFFYMFIIPYYILILAFTIIIDYYAGLLIEGSEGRKRKMYLVMSLVANIGILVFFKYWNFLFENVNLLAQLFHSRHTFPLLNILLPIGLSFHTFQAMSYTIEVFRGNQKAERHFGIYALYVMFFPQLVAGPIERPQNLLHQFHEKHRFNYAECALGIQQIGWGIFKKTVVADRLARFTDKIFDHPHDASSISIVIAAIFFAYEIYCDFSGYSDIALGSARVMGFKLMQNFDRPYLATSISDFWRRWHISLSTWLSDYLFKPLAIQFRDYAKYGVVAACMITFLISGIWHGAAWHYVVYGLVYGLALSFEVLFLKRIKKSTTWIPARLRVFSSQFLVFTFVCLAFILFRAQSLSIAFFLIKHSFGVFHEFGNLLHHKRAFASTFFNEYLPTGTSVEFASGILAIVALRIFQMLNARYDLRKVVYESAYYYRLPVCTIFVVMIYVFGVFENKEFIYFQF